MRCGCDCEFSGDQWATERLHIGALLGILLCRPPFPTCVCPALYPLPSAFGPPLPPIRYCGGTEIGGGFLSGCLWRPQAPSTFSTPTLGSQLVLLTDQGQVRLPCHTTSSITGCVWGLG